MIPVASYALVQSVLSENGKNCWLDPDTVFLLPCSGYFLSFPIETAPHASTWVVTSIIDKLLPDAVSTTNVNSDHNPSTCLCTILTNISSSEVEVNDIVVVFCFHGKKIIFVIGIIYTDDFY
jgi:hypothetical protein